MILQLDVGNSAVKWRTCRGQDILERGILPSTASVVLPQLAEAPAEVWIASVAGEEGNSALSAEVSGRWQLEPWFAESSAADCGVTNSYREPSRMGVDRWLAMIAAWARVGKALCVVDAGSALTIDLLDSQGCHRGGYILPGMAMMERSLLGETARVRYGDAPRDNISPGRSTEEAVLNGLQLAQAGSVALALDRFGGDCELVFSGGNGYMAMQLLDRGGSYVEDLVLDGLARLGSERRRTGALPA